MSSFSAFATTKLRAERNQPPRSAERSSSPCATRRLFVYSYSHATELVHVTSRERSASSARFSRWKPIPMLVLGTYMGLMTLALFETHRGPSAASHAHAQTMAFAGMILAETLVVFNFRTLHAPLWSIGLFSNPWLIVAWTATIGLQLAAIYTEPMQKLLHTVPLSAQDWMTLLSCVAPAVILFELAKFLRWRRKAR